MRIHDIVFIFTFLYFRRWSSQPFLKFLLAVAVTALVWWAKDGRLFWGCMVLLSLFSGSFYYHLYHSADQQTFHWMSRYLLLPLFLVPKSGLDDQQLDVTLQKPYGGK